MQKGTQTAQNTNTIHADTQTQVQRTLNGQRTRGGKHDEIESGELRAKVSLK